MKKGTKNRRKKRRRIGCKRKNLLKKWCQSWPKITSFAFNVVFPSHHQVLCNSITDVDDFY